MRHHVVSRRQDAGRERASRSSRRWPQSESGAGASGADGFARLPEVLGRHLAGA